MYYKELLFFNLVTKNVLARFADERIGVKVKNTERDFTGGCIGEIFDKCSLDYYNK